MILGLSFSAGPWAHVKIPRVLLLLWAHCSLVCAARAAAERRAAAGGAGHPLPAGGAVRGAAAGAPRHTRLAAGTPTAKRRGPGMHADIDGIVVETQTKLFTTARRSGGLQGSFFSTYLLTECSELRCESWNPQLSVAELLRFVCCPARPYFPLMLTAPSGADRSPLRPGCRARCRRTPRPCSRTQASCTPPTRPSVSR